MSALRTWVQSGGRLLVVADGAGPVWRELWTEQMQLPMQLSDIERVTASEALEQILERVPAADETPLASNALTVSARVASLTTWGASNGWKIDLLTVRTNGDSTGGLLATGPFGGGIASVLTIEPQRLSKTLSASAAESIYRYITQLMASQQRIKEVTDPRTSNRWIRRYYLEQDAKQSLARLAEDANDFPEIGPTVFVLITVAMSGMGLLIGPVDALLTRRRARRGITTWWSAMGWIILASIVAILAPSLSRSGKTHFNHASAREVLISSDASALEWSTDLFATFAGKPIRYQIPPLPDGTWCRGVSLNGNNGGSGTAFTPLTLPVSATAEGLWQSRPAPLVQSQWTLRTLLNTSSPRPSSVRASLEQRGDGLAFSLSGLDPLAIVESVHIEAMGSRFVIAPVVGAKADSLPDRELKLDLSTRPPSTKYSDMDPWEESDLSAAKGAIAIDHLSGFGGRTDTLRRLRDAGTHATANVFFRLPPSGVPDGLDPRSTQQASTLRLRVTFPIDEQTAQALQAVAKREAKEP